MKSVLAISVAFCMAACLGVEAQGGLGELLVGGKQLDPTTEKEYDKTIGLLYNLGDSAVGGLPETEESFRDYCNQMDTRIAKLNEFADMKYPGGEWMPFFIKGSSDEFKKIMGGHCQNPTKYLSLAKELNRYKEPLGKAHRNINDRNLRVINSIAAGQVWRGPLQLCCIFLQGMKDYMSALRGTRYELRKFYFEMIWSALGQIVQQICTLYKLAVPVCGDSFVPSERPPQEWKSAMKIAIDFVGHLPSISKWTGHWGKLPGEFASHFIPGKGDSQGQTSNLGVGERSPSGGDAGNLLTSGLGGTGLGR